jgi:ABC-type Fe3+-siderophore transport system permease subunit
VKLLLPFMALVGAVVMLATDLSARTLTYL